MTEEGSQADPVCAADRQPSAGGVSRTPPVHLALPWRRWLVRAFLAACLAGVSPAHAEDDIQLWITANTAGEMRGPYRVTAELHGRWIDDAQNYQRTVLRLQAGRALTDRLTAWFGFEENWPTAGRTATEARIWQQVVFQRPAGAWVLMNRARLEERFPDDADRMIPRLRYSLRATRPFRSQSPWGAVLSAEFFFQLRDVSRNQRLHPSGFDRDRLQAGISRRLNHGLTLEPSYTLQHINSPQPLPNRREHILQVQVAHRF
jgi:hypothetical protein